MVMKFLKLFSYFFKFVIAPAIISIASINFAVALTSECTC